MKPKYLLIAGAIVTLVFGLGTALVPEPLASFFGVALAQPGTLFARLFGTAFLGFSVLNWFARNVTEAGLLRPIVLGNLIMDLTGFVVSLAAQLTGMSNALGWIIVALYLLFTLGFGYLFFKKE